jgi:hypothetical protein
MVFSYDSQETATMEHNWLLRMKSEESLPIAGLSNLPSDVSSTLGILRKREILAIEGVYFQYNGLFQRWGLCLTCQRYPETVIKQSG